MDQTPAPPAPVVATESPKRKTELFIFAGVIALIIIAGLGFLIHRKTTPLPLPPPSAVNVNKAPLDPTKNIEGKITNVTNGVITVVDTNGHVQNYYSAGGFVVYVPVPNDPRDASASADMTDIVTNREAAITLTLDSLTNTYQVQSISYLPQ